MVNPEENNAEPNDEDWRTAKDVKNEYLSTLVHQLCYGNEDNPEDLETKKIIDEHPNEYERDCLLIDYLLVHSNMYDFNKTYVEIHRAMMQSFLKHQKNSATARKYKAQAEIEMARQNWPEAIHYLGSAIRFQSGTDQIPRFDKKTGQNIEGDMLTELFQMRGRCFFQAGNLASACINYRLAEHRTEQGYQEDLEKYPMTMSLYRGLTERENSRKYYRLIKKYDKVNNSVNVFAVNKQEWPKDTLLISDYPTAFYSILLLETCFGCTTQIPWECYWPCSGCSSVVYCSKHCAENEKASKHKLECGFTKYVQNSPLLALLLRCYSYSDEPLGEDDGQIPMDSIEKAFFKNNRNDAILQGIRQLADQRRSTWISSFDQYYALLILSIEFLCMYQHLRGYKWQETQDMPTSTNPVTIRRFDWAGRMADKPVSLIAKIFCDIKRFCSLKSAKFINTLAGDEETTNRAEERCLLFEAELMMQQHGQLKPNVVWTIYNGVILFINTCDIKPDQPMILNPERMYINLNLTKMNVEPEQVLPEPPPQP